MSHCLCSDTGNHKLEAQRSWGRCPVSLSESQTHCLQTRERSRLDEFASLTLDARGCTSFLRQRCSGVVATTRLHATLASICIRSINHWKVRDGTSTHTYMSSQSVWELARARQECLERIRGTPLQCATHELSWHDHSTAQLTL